MRGLQYFLTLFGKHADLIVPGFSSSAKVYESTAAKAHVIIKGKCKECEAELKAYVYKKPKEGNDVIFGTIIENYNKSYVHKNKRSLRGLERKKVAEEMVDKNILPCIMRIR